MHLSGSTFGNELEISLKTHTSRIFSFSRSFPFNLFHEKNKIKKWKGEKKDGAIWPNSLWAVMINDTLCRGKVSNAWAGADEDEESDKIDQGKKVELTLIDNGMAKQIFRKRELYMLPEDLNEKNYSSFSKMLGLQIKQPFKLDSEVMNGLFTQIVKDADGTVFAKPITKQPITGGGERSIVQLYLPPLDFAKRKNETFNSLSGLVCINDLVSDPKQYENWVDKMNKYRNKLKDQKPQEEWIME